MKVDVDESGLLHSFPLEGRRAEDFAERLLDGLSPVDLRVTSDWSAAFDSIAERRFFRGQLTRFLGRGIALLEAQRPLESMLDSESVGARAFAEQRVDFSIESPDRAKICFELDGPAMVGYPSNPLTPHEMPFSVPMVGAERMLRKACRAQKIR